MLSNAVCTWQSLTRYQSPRLVTITSILPLKRRVLLLRDGSYNFINLLAKLTEQMAVCSLNFLPLYLFRFLLNPLPSIYPSLHLLLSNFPTVKTGQYTELRMVPWTAANSVPARHRRPDNVGQTMSASKEHWSFAIIRRLKCVGSVRLISL